MLQPLSTPHKLTPRKHLGQNFLVNRRIVEKIIATAHLTTSDVVLEVGPGLGALTLALARLVKKVIAVEKDPRAIIILSEKLREEGIVNVELVEKDILHYLENADLPRFLVVANIPYYLTSAFIRTLLTRTHKPERIILTIQKEVAERICARDRKESLLSLSVKFFANPKILFTISRGSFFPIPKVDSAVIEIIPHADPRAISEDRFFTIIKAGFSSPRKKLASNLAQGLGIEKKGITETLELLGINPSIRPEQLTISQWLSLCLEVEPLNMK